MCHALLSSKRVKFVVRKKNWRLDMKSYRSSLHQSLLFRKEVAEILEGTELEHLSNNLDVLAKNNVGLKEMMRTMNRSLPIKPEFRDGVSDEKVGILFSTPKLEWHSPSLCGTLRFSIAMQHYTLSWLCDAEERHN